MAEDVSCVSITEFIEFCDKQYPDSLVSKTSTMRKDRCDKIARYLQGLEQAPQGSWRYRIEQKGYTLVNFPSLGLENVLCVKGTGTNGGTEQRKYKQWRRVVPVEEFYDILLEAHVQVQNHGGYKTLLRTVQLDYAGIPREAAVKFVSLCSVCQSNVSQRTRAAKATEANRERVVKTLCTTDAFNMRCQVDLMAMDQNIDGNYTHVGLCMDHWTRFLTLFPMSGGSVDHVAYGLTSSVYPYFGPPRFLHSPEGKEYASQVVELSMATWKGGEKTAMPQGRAGLESLGQVLEEAQNTVLEKINNRAMAESLGPPLPWASWLGKIMFDLNNRCDETTGLSPFSRVFEQNISMPVAGETNEPIKDVAYKDRRHPESSVAPKEKAATSTQENDVAAIVNNGPFQPQQYFMQQAPVLIQPDAASVQAPVIIQPDAASMQAPLMMQPDTASVQAPVMMQPDAASMQAPIMMQADAALMQAPLMMQPDAASVQAPVMMQPDAASMQAPVMMQADAALMQAPIMMQADAASMQAPIMLQPDAASVQAPIMMQSSTASIQAPVMIQADAASVQAPIIMQPNTASIQAPVMMQAGVASIQAPVILQPDVVSIQAPVLMQPDMASIQAPVLMQPGTASMPIVVEDDAVVPVAATEVMVNTRPPQEQEMFTTTCVDPSGQVQNIIVSVRPAKR